MSTIHGLPSSMPPATNRAYPRKERVAPNQDIEHGALTAGYCAVPVFGAVCHVGLEVGEVFGGAIREALKQVVGPGGPIEMKAPRTALTMAGVACNLAGTAALVVSLPVGVTLLAASGVIGAAHLLSAR